MDTATAAPMAPGTSDATQPTAVATKIVVLDRGFVYVGKTQRQGDELVITDARCIRRWGTTKGLGELVDGPKSNTVLDVAGTVTAPMRAVIFTIQCNRDW